MFNSFWFELVKIQNLFSSYLTDFVIQYNIKNIFENLKN